jgi:hypothetical protein
MLYYCRYCEDGDAQWTAHFRPACLARDGKQAIYLPVSVHLNFVKTCVVEVRKSDDAPVKRMRLETVGGGVTLCCFFNS